VANVRLSRGWVTVSGHGLVPASAARRRIDRSRTRSGFVAELRVAVLERTRGRRECARPDRVRGRVPALDTQANSPRRGRRRLPTALSAAGVREPAQARAAARVRGSEPRGAARPDIAVDSRAPRHVPTVLLPVVVHKGGNKFRLPHRAKGTKQGLTQAIRYDVEDLWKLDKSGLQMELAEEFIDELKNIGFSSPEDEEIQEDGQILEE
jgi:hypothetical protein